MVRSRGEPNGDHAMAFLTTHNIAEHDRNQSVETEPEAEISDFVRRDVVSNPGRQPENQSQLVASNINSLLQRTTAISVQEIDKLITELQTLSDMLHNESSRVQREIVQYSTFTQATLRSTKIIAESLEQWRKAPDAQTLSD
jgi:N-acetyl-beta-hexosaminidase